MKRKTIMMCALGISMSNLYAMHEAGESSRQLACSFQTTKAFPHRADFVTIAPDNETILSASVYERSVVLSKGQNPAQTVHYNHSVNNAAFSSDGEMAAIAVGHDESNKGFSILKITNTQTISKRRFLEKPDTYCASLAFTHDNKKVVASDGISAWIVNIETGDVERTFDGTVENRILKCLLRKNILMTLFQDGKAQIVTTDTNQQLQDVQYASEELRSISGNYGSTVAMSNDAIAMLNGPAKLRMCNVYTQEALPLFKPDNKQLVQQLGVIRAIGLSPDGTTLGLGSYDGTVGILNGQTGKIQHMIKHAKYAINAVLCSPDNEHMLVLPHTGRAAIYAVKTGKMVFEFDRADNPQSAAFSPNGNVAVVGGNYSVQVVEKKRTQPTPAAQVSSDCTVS